MLGSGILADPSCRRGLVRDEAPPLRGVAGRQHAAERLGETTVAEACAVTAGFLKSLFAQLPTVLGLGGADTAALADLGENVGHAVYLLDALEDLTADRSRGHFNPALHRMPDGRLEIDLDRLGACVLKLERALESVRAASARVAWRRNCCCECGCNPPTECGCEACCCPCDGC